MILLGDYSNNQWNFRNAVQGVAEISLFVCYHLVQVDHRIRMA